MNTQTHQFATLLESRIPYPFTTPQRGTPQKTLNIVTAKEFVTHKDHLVIQWVWEGFIAVGTLVMLVARPKLGKTTLVFHLLAAVLAGQRFLGYLTTPVKVLILALEEHAALVGRRLTKLGLDTSTDLFLRMGSLNPTPTVVEELNTFIREHHIGLLVIDTLAQFWQVKEENDATQTTQALKTLQQLAQDTNCAILLIHHSRKAEGVLGDEVRGSSAILGTVDVGIFLKGHVVPTQRKVTTRSRYDETPGELIIQLCEKGYVQLGASKVVSKAARTQRVKEALEGTLESLEVIAERAVVSKGQARVILNVLFEQGHLHRSGKGTRGHPFLYSKVVRVRPRLRLIQEDREKSG